MTFSAKNDYLLPIGAFAEKLLGDDVSPHTKDAVAGVQSLLVVFDKYFEIAPDLDEAAAKKQKSDFMFGNMHRDYLDLKNELMDTVPHDVDVANEISQARALVDSGQGVPNVPAFGMILSKKLGRDRVNQCLLAQSALRTIALAEKWPGHEKIVPARIFDNDPKNLNVMQSVMNDILEHPESSDVQCHAARDVAVTALSGLANQLGHDMQFHAVDALSHFLVQQKPSQMNFDNASRQYFNLRQSNAEQKPGFDKGLSI